MCALRQKNDDLVVRGTIYVHRHVLGRNSWDSSSIALYVTMSVGWLINNQV